MSDSKSISSPNPKKFFDYVKKNIDSSLEQKQIDGFNTIIIKWNELSPQNLDHRHLAYVLATAWHETAHTMQPIEEIGKGRGRSYGQKHAPIHSGSSKRVKNDEIYYGRGYVQLTWFSNYLAQTERIGVDLITNPQLALRADIAADILINGMIKGEFTGKKLTDYISGSRTDWYNARRIVNGTDRANEIARLASKFNEALIASGMED